MDAQTIGGEEYEDVTWAKFAKAYEEAKAVASGEDEYSAFNSRIYDVKYNLMVAYKQLLKKADSLIDAGGTAELLGNIKIAEGILAKSLDEIELSDVAIAKGLTKEQALGHLIEGLGYYYQARYSKHDIEVQRGEKTAGELKVNDDGTPMMYNLYDESAYEYADNDRPNKQANQAKVDKVNANLVDCIAYFATEAPAAPVLSGVNTGVVDETNKYVYGVVAGTEDFSEFFAVENGSFTVDGVGTGATLTVLNDKGEVAVTYTLVIFGDVNGDGEVTATDASAIKVASLGGSLNGDVQAFAADVNGDGEVTATDSSAVKVASLGGSITVNPYVA